MELTLNNKQMTSNINKAEKTLYYRLFRDDNLTDTPSAAELSTLMENSEIENRSKILRNFITMRGKVISIVV